MPTHFSYTAIYSFLQKHWFTSVLTGLVLFSAFIRFYQLGSVPEGISWDEAAVGYNGYAVVTTLRDEWLDAVPISFKSFGDYKAPAAIYLNGLFTVVLGLEPWVIRLPFALSGVLGVMAMVLVTRELWWFYQGKGTTVKAISQAQCLGLLAGFMLSTSPWHLHFTRTAFESGIALTLILWGLFFWLRFWSQNNLKTLLISLTLFMASLYTYHSPKLFVPLMMALLLILSLRNLRARFKQLLIGGVWSLGLLVPLFYDSVFGAGATRLTQATLKGEQLAQLVVSQFLAHLQPDFLIGGVTTTLRHGDGQWGVLLLSVFGLALLALPSFFFKGDSRIRNFGFFSLGWIALGLIPAAIGVDVPHANRSLLALPGFIWLACIGVDFLSHLTGRQVSGRKKGSNSLELVQKTVLGTLFLGHCLIFIKYQHHYYTTFAAASGADFQAQSLPTFSYVDQLAKEVDPQQILVSNRYGSAYIFILVANKVSPFEHQYGGLSKYKIVDHVNIGHLNEPNSLIVATAEDDIPFDKAIRTFTDASGKLRYAVFRTAP